MARFHFIGIGGAGLSPIARYLLEKGHQVSGSDMQSSPSLLDLEKSGVQVFTGHHSKHVQNADVIIRSSAIADTNVEVQAGIERGIPVIKRRDFLRELTSGKKVIAVAGTHGKTTTTAMLSWSLSQMNLDPSFIIGGISKNMGTNAHAGEGEFFVIEADEYDRMFLGLNPTVLVITNVEHDHPDSYPTHEQYFEAFMQLTTLIQPGGMLLACDDHPGAQRLLESAKGDFSKHSYGTSEKCDFRARDIHHRPRCGTTFDFEVKNADGISPIRVDLLLSGNHNALNACAVMAVIHLLGLDLGIARDALQAYSGTGRRFDIQGEAGGIVVIDDYAHHPSEIRVTLAGARCRYPDNPIWCVWQPHTYSRTRELIHDFATAFTDCDHVIVTDIYASREQKQDFSSSQLVSRMDHPDARHIARFSATSKYLMDHLQPGDVLLVLSAGDADQISREIINHYQTREGHNHGK